jgi:hypothetical protein
MASWTTSTGTTFNLPDEGTVFRDQGDNTASTLYQVKDGQLVNLAQTQYAPKAVANTRFSVNGQVYEPGSYLDPLGPSANVQWLDPSYRGAATSLVGNVGDMYDRMNTPGSYQKLGTYNLADIQTALAANQGRLPSGAAAAPFDASLVGYKNPNVAMQSPQPVASLSSVAGQNITQQNAEKLNQFGQYTFNVLPSGNVDIMENGKSISQGGPGFSPEYAASLGYNPSAQAAQVLAGMSPATQKLAQEIQQAAASGNLTAQQQMGYTNLQTMSDNLKAAQVAAQQAQQSGDYTSMDKYMTFIENQNKLYTDALTKYYQDVAPLRQQMAQSLVPGVKEQNLQTQLASLQNQAQQFKMQTEEDKFNEYQGQTLGFAGGRASEIDIRANFKLQRMALDEANLLSQLGLEQKVREMQGQSAEAQLGYLAEDFNLQQQVQEKITANEDRLFERADKLEADAKSALFDILSALEGIDPSQMSPESQKQLEQMSAQAGLPYSIVKDALTVQNQKRVFDEALATAKEQGSGLSGPSSYQEWILAGSPGTYADFLETRKPPTAAQETVGTYAARLEQSNPLITALTGDIETMPYAVFVTQKGLPSSMQKDSYRQFDQAARNFINATLRRESGAVISDQEFDNAYMQYLPRPGDDAVTRKNKKENRDLIQASFKKSAGPSYQSVDELLGGAQQQVSNPQDEAANAVYSTVVGQEQDSYDDTFMNSISRWLFND